MLTIDVLAPAARSLLCGLSLLAFAAPAWAIDAFWSNNRGDGSGTFSSATNWSPSVPGASDVAHFGMTTSSLDPKTYTVSFVTAATNESLVVEDDRITFDLNGNAYFTTAPISRIGTVAGRTARLTIVDGAWDFNSTSGSFLSIGDVLGSAGVLTVSTGGRFLSETILVGFQGQGTLVVQNGGEITTPNTFVGGSPLFPGTARVTGANSRLTLADRIDVGPGALVVENGGAVTSPVAIVGGFQTGTATVTGANSRLSLENLNLGENGAGTLTVNAGGLLETSSNSVLGNTSGVGTISIDGANSTWTSTGTVDVARLGEGAVNITGGAHATLGAVSIGPVQTPTSSLDAGTGKVTVSGASSQLTGGIRIGGRPDGTGSGELVVSDGGLVKALGTTLEVAPNGGGKLSITSGGRIESVFGTVVTHSRVGNASVSGAGSQWINTADLFVVFGTGQGTLTISDGGLVQNVNGVIGPSIIDETSAGVVTVTGAASEWKNTGTLTVGRSGPGTLTISAGGVVRSAAGFVGALAGKLGAVNIDGGGSQWISSADIQIGASGDGAVTLTNAGAIQAQNVKVESHGALGGNGTISGNVQNNGIVAPGDSIGTLDIIGAFAQQPGGTLEIEVGGASGSHVDLLNVGAATLDGELRLRLIAGIVPAVNVALSATSLSGQFDNVINGQRLTTVDGLASFVVNYGAGSAFSSNQVVLSAFQSALSADFDDDGDVDSTDLAIWRGAYHLNQLGDADGDNDTDGNDLMLWQQQVGSKPAVAATAAVPEPSTGLLAIAAAAVGRAILLWPRRRRLY